MGDTILDKHLALLGHVIRREPSELIQKVAVDKSLQCPQQFYIQSRRYPIRLGDWYPKMKELTRYSDVKNMFRSTRKTSWSMWVIVPESKTI